MHAFTSVGNPEDTRVSPDARVALDATERTTPASFIL